MALNTLKCNHLMPLPFKGLTHSSEIPARRLTVMYLRSWYTQLTNCCQKTGTNVQYIFVDIVPNFCGTSFWRSLKCCCKLMIRVVSTGLWYHFLHNVCLRLFFQIARFVVLCMQRTKNKQQSLCNVMIVLLILYQQLLFRIKTSEFFHTCTELKTMQSSALLYYISS